MITNCYLKEEGFSTLVNDIRTIVLDTASEIGTKICDSALWEGSQCNWIGRSIQTDELSPPTSKALGPELYDGTSGIALFLSYLYLSTDKEKYRRTAEGAIMHAFSHANDIHSICRFGFYSGCIGIAYAASSMGLMFKDHELFEKALSLLQELALDLQTSHLMDLISGNAGTIPALLNMYQVFREKSILDLALHLGEELLSMAVKQPFGWSWDHRANGISTSRYNLTGFSHGAAGIGYSLLELYGKTEKKEFREGAEQAFSYENHWFNAQHSNWPDFRTFSNNNNDFDHQTFTYAVSWCHGAPGIALSRLRAYQILRQEKYLQDCQAALYATIQNMRGNDAMLLGNYSLCHGLGGNSDVLLYAYSVLNTDSYKEVAFDVGMRGINRYRNRGLPWPCGIKNGETPALMVGLAGIGHFYLRLYDPKRIPSVLMLTPALNR
jgi:type 2 lantibiotic biosynthesis protein LanM